MKLLSLNVALFEPNNSKLSKFVKGQDADIVCFQEVTRALDKNVLKKYISKDPIDSATSKLPSGFYGPTETFGSFELKEFHGKDIFRFDPGGMLELGNYTKSKYPIKKAQNIFIEGHFTYNTDPSNWPEEDYRAVLVADLDLGKNNLRVINYHGIWTKDKLGNERTLSACQKIKDLALEAKGQVIICGDFNLFPDTPSMKVFQTNFISLVDRYNIRATRPSSNELNGQDRNVVDYILLSRNVKVKSFNVLGTDVSDHLPLVLEFELPKNISPK
jgi:endonuclease/exonuclease/phosphatase family metal-dependent hydrolase